MFKHKKLACFFFFILTIFWSVCAHAMDGDEDFTQFTTPTKNRDSLNRLEEGQGSTVSLHSLSNNQDGDQDLLEKLYAPTVSRVTLPESVRQVVSGFTSLIPLFPTGQVFVPIALIGLLSLGLTKYVIPDAGWESWALVGGVGIPIAVAALISAYTGTSQFFKPKSDDVTKVQNNLFDREHSTFESWSRSYPTQFIQTLFWGGLFFALLMNTESRVTGWGDYRILGGIFGTLALIPIYFILTRATNDINKYAYRSYKHKREEKQKEACLYPIEATKEYIKDHGLTSDIGELGVLLNVIEKPILSNITVNNDSPLITEISQDTEQRDPSTFSDALSEDVPDLIIATQPSKTRPLYLADNLLKLKYQRVFEKMIEISGKTSAWVKDWNFRSTKVAKYSSRIAQVLSIPAEALIAYALPHSLLTYLEASPEVALGVSATISIAYTLYYPLIAGKENGLIWREHEQMFRLYKPQVTCGYFGERIAPVIARLGTLLYFTFPVTDFIRNELFDKSIGLTNVPAQALILAPFMAGIGLAAPAQFLDRAYTTLANWVTTGGRVTLPKLCCDCDCSFKLFRLFCCSDDKDERALALEILGRVQEMEDNTFRLNDHFTEILRKSLKISPALSSDEETHLLSNESGLENKNV